MVLKTKTDLLDTLRDELNTKSINFYDALGESYKKLNNSNLNTTHGAIVGELLKSQEEFAKEQSKAYTQTLQEPRKTMEEQGPLERKATFALQTKFHEQELTKIKEKFEEAKKHLEKIKGDDKVKNDLLKTLHDEHNKLTDQAKKYYEEQKKLMSELVYLAYAPEMRQQYKKIYGKEAPMFDTREDVAKLYKESAKVIVKGVNLDYGMIEVHDGVVSFEISSPASREAALQHAIMDYRARNLGMPDEPAKVNVHLPDPTTDLSRISQEGYIQTMMLEAAAMGAKLEVKLGKARQTYSPPAEVIKQRDDLLKAWQRDQKEKIATFEKKREEDIKAKSTESLAKRK